MTTTTTPVLDPFGLQALSALTVGERVINPDDIPWVPYAEGIAVKPLRLNRRTGLWANLTRVDGGVVLNRHYHGSAVTGFVLEGSWYYRERDWVARKGMLIFEPPGDIHTLVSNPEGTISFFQLEGPLFYLDDDDHVIGFDDVLQHTKTYHDYCASQGIEPVDLDF